MRPQRIDPRLLALLGLGAVLMGWGVWRVAPHQLVGDEWAAVAKALLIQYHRPVVPLFTKGGNLHLRILGVSSLLLAGGWLATGRYGMVVPAMEIYAYEVPLDPGPLLTAYYEAVVVGRLVSVVFGLATVYLVYTIAREVADDRAGLLAALTLVASVGFISASKVATEDVGQAALVTLALLFLVRSWDGRNERQVLLAAIVTGFAIGMKATSGLLLLPLVAAIVHLDTGRPGWVRRTPRRAPFFGLVAAASYFLTTPSAIYYPAEWVEFVADHVGIISGTGQAAPYPLPGPSWTSVAAHLAQSLGLWLFLVSAVTVVVTVGGLLRGRFDRRLWLVLGFGGSYVAVLLLATMAQYPRVILLHPTLAICTGVVVADRLRATTPLARAPAYAALAIVLVSVVATGVTASGFATSRGDATDWAAANLEPGAEVDTYGYRLYLPEFPDGVRVNRHPNGVDAPDVDRHRLMARVSNGCPDYIVVTSYNYERYLRSPGVHPELTAFYRSLLAGTDYRPVGRFGPRAVTDFTPGAKFVGSATFDLRASKATANPTILVLERSGPPAPACD